jgi:uncharacterized membrane protein
VAYVLALFSAAFYGAADFLGGLTARRASTTAAVVVAQGSGLVLLAIAVPFLPAASPTRHDLLWGGIAGIAGSVGVALLYAALAIGTMAVVAPITAVCAVAIPVLAGVLLGERLATAAVVGIALALVAIVLVSQQPSSPLQPAVARRRFFAPGIPQALCSGVAIGLFFLALARTQSTAGMWPLLVARGTSVVLFCAFAASGGTSLRMPARVLGLAVGCGALDVIANALYLVATRYGALSLVVTLASLYPASTVLLARLALGERLSRLQIAGIACALIAVVLIVSA